MSPLLFIIRKTLKNIIKRAFKKPVVLIGYIIVILFFGAALFGTLKMPSGMVRKGSPEFFTGIMVLVFAVLNYTTLKLGIEKGSTYFRMSDVNLVFTSPIKPNHVLLYAFIKQIGGTFLLLFIAFFQIPNLKNNFVMQDNGVLMIMLAVVAYALSYPLISMVIYSWTSQAKARKKLMKNIFDIGAAIIALLFILSVSQTRDFGASINAVFNHPIAKYFPVIGWTGSIASAAVTGFTTEFWVGASGMLLLIVGSSIALYKMNLDYYEDVLEGTEYMEAALKAKREGRNIMFNAKVKEKVNQKLGGTGAGAIFSKQLLEIRKTAYFLFFDRLSVTVILSALIFNFVMPTEAKVFSLALILFFALYMLLLFQVQGRLGTELDKPYIFLIPASSSEKLFYTTLSEHVKNLFDASLLFIFAGVLFKASVPVILACIVAYVAFGAVFVYTDVLNRRLFGGIHSKGLLIFIKIIVSILIQIPGGVAAGFVFAATESEVLMICALGAWSLVLAITFFLFSSGILNNLEAAD
ncbi:MAG: putative ABC exporter domain-containing protein [Clostridia bacterium]|nr:putative ABC exporter domain-containing protein [Clostridia bacterium]